MVCQNIPYENCFKHSTHTLAIVQSSQHSDCCCNLCQRLNIFLNSETKTPKNSYSLDYVLLIKTTSIDNLDCEKRKFDVQQAFAASAAKKYRCPKSPNRLLTTTCDSLLVVITETKCYCVPYCGKSNTFCWQHDSIVSVSLHL